MNKIYIPEEYQNTLFERLPFSSSLLAFLKKNKLFYLKQLQQTTPEIIKQIIESSKKPFPELRRFLTQLQKSPSGKVILEQDIDNELLNQENNNEEQIIEEITIPRELRELPISYLIPSNKLSILLKKNNIHSLKELHGIQYKTLLQKPNFGNKSVSELKELVKFVNKFESINNFESILFASIKRKKAEELAKDVIKKEKAEQTVENPIRKHNSSKKKSFYGFKLQASKTKISIPKLYKEISISSIQISARLKNILKINKIAILGELENFSYNQLKKTPSCGNKSIVELQEFISRIQKSNTINDCVSLLVSDLSLPKLMIFVNKFLEEISSIEKEILLDRLGGSNDERVLKFEEIGEKHQITKERANQKYAKAVIKFKERLGNSADALLEEIENNCVESVCFLTPQFLIYLTNNEYNLFSYPPAFYIRLIGILSLNIPVLPELKDKGTNLGKDNAKITKQIIELLESSPLPLSLTEIFNQISVLNMLKKDGTKIFFEAIQSPKFNLINGDKPNELYIELA